MSGRPLIFACCALSLLVSSLWIEGQRSPRPKPKPSVQGGARWVSRVGQKVARKADAGLVGTVERITRLRGGAMARLRVDEVLFGEAIIGKPARGPAVVTVLARVPDYFPSIGRQICVMVKGRRGERLAAISRLALAEELDRTRLTLLRKVLAVERSGTSPTARAMRLKGLMFEALEASMGALHLLAVGELLHLLERHPAAFDRRDLGRLRSVTRGALHPRVAPLVARLKQRLGRLPNTSAARVSFYRTAIRAASTDEERGKHLAAAVAELESEAIDLLATFLRDRSASTRLQAAVLLGRLDDPAAGAPLGPMIQRERDPTVRVAMIEAIGRLRFGGAVDTLRPALAEKATSRPAMFALGRIATPAARDALTAWREQLRTAGEDERAKAVDFVLSQKFAEQEARVDRLRRKSRIRLGGRK